MTASGPGLPRRVITHAPSERLPRHGCPTPAVAAHQHGQLVFRIKLSRSQWDLPRPSGNSSSVSGRRLPSFFSAGVSLRAGRPAGPSESPADGRQRLHLPTHTRLGSLETASRLS